MPDNPSIGGIFGSEQGENTLGFQLALAPTNTIDVALHYINSYSPYRYRLSDNITITPGFVVIFEPAHTPDSDTIFIGALRTTFTF